MKKTSGVAEFMYAKPILPSAPLAIGCFSAVLAFGTCDQPDHAPGVAPTSVHLFINTESYEVLFTDEIIKNLIVCERSFVGITLPHIYGCPPGGVNLVKEPRPGS